MKSEYFDGNILIAKFMGLVQNNTFEFITKVGACHPNGMKYYKSWDWLMPVVEKLGNTRIKSEASYNPDYEIRIEIVNGYTKIEGLGKRIFYNSCVCGSMLLATYGAVVEAIERVNYLKSKRTS